MTFKEAMARLFRRRERKAVTPERRMFRMTVLAFLVMFVVFGIGGVATVLLALRGPDVTQVPDLVREEFVDAVILLQERGLYPEVQLRYFSDPALKGRVVSQEPEAGAVVRAGRRITLLVSQGAVIERVGDYRGQLLADVRADLQALGGAVEGVLFIDAVSYVFDDSEAGTIIEQDPPPETDLAGTTGLDLVVSRGPDVERFSLPTYLGLGWSDALAVLSRDDVPFVFQLESQPTIGRDGVIVAQSPEPATQVERGTPIELTIRTVRDLGIDERFGIFDRTLPEYAVPVELTAVVVGPEGESATLFTMEHPGGRVAFPYELEVGSTIILYRFDDEVIRFIIRDGESES